MASLSNLRLSWDRSRSISPPSAGNPLLAALPFAAALIDADGNIREHNNRWLTIPEATPAGQSYQTFCNRLVSTDAEAGAGLSAGIRAVLVGRQSEFVFEYPIAATLGVRCARTVVTPFYGPDYSGALLVCEHPQADLTPAAESAADDQRRQSQKMETVGRLVGGVAHDFANLLTLIAGYSDILLNRISQMDPLRAELDEIRKAANRGSRLTAQLLGFTRGQSVQPCALDLNLIVSDMQRMLGPIIGEYVQLETALDPALGRIVADPGQMEQVIMNLVLNARDAMPSGGCIRIETANCQLTPEEAASQAIEPGPCIRLTISDNGQGMDVETMTHLFEPFFTTKPEGKGTGLGLSTVHGIVRQNRGAIRAHSLPGEGTSFIIWLPQAAATLETPELSTTRVPRPSSGHETILLVEDEDNVRRLLTHVLAKRGYTVLEASSGEEALEVFTANSTTIDLLLTDMVMPRMSGRELSEKIRELQPAMKVIYMSGYTDDVLVRTGALSPGMSFLQKPLRPEVLAARVREALDASPIRSSASAI